MDHITHEELIAPSKYGASVIYPLHMLPWKRVLFVDKNSLPSCGLDPSSSHYHDISLGTVPFLVFFFGVGTT